MFTISLLTLNKRIWHQNQLPCDITPGVIRQCMKTQGLSLKYKDQRCLKYPTRHSSLNEESSSLKVSIAGLKDSL